MAQTKMADQMDDIAKQARQGSVAAIIQILNEELADSGVRTRAMFAEGILQILCEAATPEQLEQWVLVPRIRQILEAISPRNIRRVNINSRIVREQQLLWLEEINRDPENQLLWSEEIILAKPHLFKQLAEDLKSQKPAKNKTPLPKAPRSVGEKRQFWRGIVGGTSLSLFLLLVGWALYDWLSPKLNYQMQVQAPQSSPIPATSQTPVNSTPSQTPVRSTPSSEPFAEAVRLAEQASAAGKAAQSSAQWLDIAAKWQRASDLMGSVQSSDSRYKTAQNRMVVYGQHSNTAQTKAQKRRP
ncbi:MAG: hypothetical protein KME08_11430 [Aphanothece sp. CMT-3BRIN-NPC111]|jgi:hypothetical protein|nr:hypothetical protein [Aphanothece sp. CMT-3BRIN-NPC111]